MMHSSGSPRLSVSNTSSATAARAERNRTRSARYVRLARPYWLRIVALICTWHLHRDNHHCFTRIQTICQAILDGYQLTSRELGQPMKDGGRIQALHSSVVDPQPSVVYNTPGSHHERSIRSAAPIVYRAA